MDAKLAKILLRIVQSGDVRFSANEAMKDFVQKYGESVASLRGKSFYISPEKKQVIRDLLSGAGIDPNIPPDAWNGLTRAEALELGNNEKYARDPVKRRRVAVKALRPSMPLVLKGQATYLPARCHADVDYDEVGDMQEHDIIIVVENWECFNDIHVAADNPALKFPGDNPLVVWRGDKDGTRSDAMLAMLRNLKQPVAAFVDYDPSGMVIARSLPRMQQLVSPPLDVLTRMMGERGLVERYLDQIAGCQAILERRDVACIIKVWGVIRLTGMGLPQEQFVRDMSCVRTE